jgi:acyl dehydratase
MPTVELETPQQLRALVGTEVAVSQWLEVEQSRINQFADATGDHQWIHVAPERAAAESPYGATIAHGFLTLSLLSALLKDALVIRGGIKMGINYGLNRVRFISAVKSGARVRGRFTLAALEEVPGGLQATWSVTVESDGGERPACVAEWLVRYYV